MATLLTKKSDTASSVPLAADLTNAAGGAELAVNTADKRLYSKTSGGAVVELGTNPSSMTLPSATSQPSGSANGIPYLNGSKVLTSGSALTFDGTTLSNTASGALAAIFNRTTSSGPTLDIRIVGNSAGTLGSSTDGNGNFDIAAASGVSLWLRSGSGVNGYTRFDTNGSEQMRLTSTGLGIGTSSPGAKLDVLTDSGTHLLLSRNTPTQSPTYIKSNADFSNLTLQAGSTAGYFSAVEVMGWNGSGNTPRVAFYTAGTEKMRLDSSGNLGLGVTPSAWGSGGKLEMGGGQIISMQGAANFASNAYYNAGWKYTTSTFASYYSQSSGQHQWYNAPSGTAGNAISFTQAMTLDASGNLLVNRTSGNAKIAVSQSGSQDTILSNIGTGGSAFTISGSGSTMTSMYMVTSSGLAGQITNSGTTTIYSVTSDHRLKNVIGSIIDAGSRIDSLEPIEYEWKSDGSRTRGFLAHKFQEVYAGSVTGTKDAVDKDGKPVYQAMQAGSAEVIADLVAEIQSLRKRLAALESK